MSEIEHMADAFWHMAQQMDDVSSVVSSFVSVVQDRGLTSQFPSILRAIEKRADVIDRAQRAVVRTAHTLEDEMKDEISGYVDDFTLHFETQKELIGGIEIQTFDRRISGTVQSMLSRLRQSFTQ